MQLDNAIAVMSSPSDVVAFYPSLRIAAQFLNRDYDALYRALTRQQPLNEDNHYLVKVDLNFTPPATEFMEEKAKGISVFDMEGKLIESGLTPKQINEKYNIDRSQISSARVGSLEHVKGYRLAPDDQKPIAITSQPRVFALNTETLKKVDYYNLYHCMNDMGIDRELYTKLIRTLAFDKKERLLTESDNWMLFRESDERARVIKKIKERRRTNTSRPSTAEIRGINHSRKPKSKHRNHTLCPVDCYTLDGQFLETYASIADGARARCCDHRNIYKAVNGMRGIRSVGSYLWCRAGEEPPEFDYKPGIYAYNLSTKEFREFFDVAEAALFIHGDNRFQAGINASLGTEVNAKLPSGGYVFFSYKSDRLYDFDEIRTVSGTALALSKMMSTKSNKVGTKQPALTTN